MTRGSRVHYWILKKITASVKNSNSIRIMLKVNNNGLFQLFLAIHDIMQMFFFRKSTIKTYASNMFLSVKIIAQ